MYKSIKNINLAGFTVTLGLILPSLFHAIPMGGKLFLPMHLPILISAFMLPYPLAVTVSLLTPILSSLLTGMPPAFPVLPLMLVELFCYVSLIRVFDKIFRLKPLFSLALSLTLGRAFLFIACLLLGLKTDSFNGVAYFLEAISYGVVGMILQLTIIPYFLRTWRINEGRI